MLRLALLSAAVGLALSESTFVPHEDLKIRLYYKDEDTYSSRTLAKALKLFSHSNYNSTLPLVMIIHGYDDDQESLIRKTVRALFKRQLWQEYNIMAVDLPEKFSFSVFNLYYLKPAMNVPVAGEALGRFFNEAIDKNLVSPEQINFISFSLGAQIAGYIGRTINGIVHSITGIDPAGIGFDMSSVLTKLTHVSQDDAEFVHLYHSNSALLGTSQRLGTADFLFNGGDTQPNCNSLLDPMCSHMRGFVYYLEALRREEGVPAIQCNSLDHLVHCKCRGNRLSHIGFPLDTKASGLYVLHTLPYPPYLQGQLGVTGYKCKRTKSAYAAKMGKRYDKMIDIISKNVKM